jgi:hypothetical protein
MTKQLQKKIAKSDLNFSLYFFYKLMKAITNWLKTKIHSSIKQRVGEIFLFFLIPLHTLYKK